MERISPISMSRRWPRRGVVDDQLPSRRPGRSIAMLAGVLLLGGCLSVRAPERINIGGGSDVEPVDAGRVPPISTVEQGRTELDKAYRYIGKLEREKEEWARDKDKLKRERDQYKQERDRYKHDRGS